MRLTLRTLLSYRDGVLPPKAHEELGQKFRESQTAQSLASRIERAISEPKPLGLELAEIQQICSPNDVSEFLDGTLPVDRVFAMESKCISSDAMLAELASIHSILARELLGTSKNPLSQPSSALMSRLYSLHDPKDRAESIPAVNTSTSAGAPTSADAFGIDLQDNTMTPDANLDSPALDYSALGSIDGTNNKKIALQTVVLALALAVLAWWILQDTSILPALQLRIPEDGSPS